MNVSRIDAEAALQDVDSARRQSRTHVGYQFGSLALLVWGALWIVAGVISAVWPDGAGAGWLVVDLIGTAAMGYLVLRNARRFSSYGASGVFRPSAQAIRFVVTAVVLGAFGAMVGLIFRPTSATEIMAFITILVAAIYMVAGLWTGLRLFCDRRGAGRACRQRLSHRTGPVPAHRPLPGRQRAHPGRSLDALGLSGRAQ